MMGVKKAKSRERNKNKNYMKQYREKASKDTKGKEEEEVEEVGVEEMVEEEGLGGGDMGKLKVYFCSSFQIKLFYGYIFVCN